MNARCGEERASASGARRGHLIAGAILLNAAAVVQFALGDLSESARGELPGVLFSLHAAGGKVPLTAPVALLGACLVIFSLIPERRPDLPPPPVGRLSSAANRVPPRARVPAPTPRRTPAHQPVSGDETLPIGEELPDQEQPPPEPRHAPASATTPRPLPRFKTKSTGNVELASAKYLDRNWKPSPDPHQV
jgi:hypothetical protein